MSKIAIFFPGMGYQHDKPLLYFSKDIAVEKGYENYIDVKYTHSGEKIRGDAEKMNAAFENMYQQAEQYLAYINWNEYDDVLFVSKSIGTIIASEYARKHSIKNIRHILYTPLTYTFKHEPQNAIGFIGTKDGWCNADDVVELAKEGDILIYTYEDCNHSLECEDTIKNIDILSDIMKKTKDFI